MLSVSCKGWPEPPALFGRGGLGYAAVSRRLADCDHNRIMILL
jgi:hypothetical protein